MRKIISLFLALGLAAAAVPVSAQEYGPDTIWGEAPAGLTNAASAVLQDSSGRIVTTVQVVDGHFVFPGVAPGQYVVVLQDGAGASLATSEPVSQTSGAVNRAIFAATRVPAAIVPSGGGLSTTTWILIGAAAAGVTTAIVVATNDSNGVASPTR